MKKYYFFFGIIFLTQMAYPQNCSICSDALKQGTKDEFQRETKHSLDESVNTLYSFDYEFWEKYQSSANHSMSLDAAYSIFSAAFGSNSSNSEKKEIFNKQKSTYLYSRTLAQNDYEKISQSLISKIPYDAFKDCIKNTCGDGIFIDYETTGDNIVVTVRWVITHGDPKQQTTLKSTPIVANATSIDYNFQKGSILKPFNSISGLYKRVDPKQDVIFSFDFENFPSKQIVVKRSKYQNTSLPVGSIVISELDYSTFCSLNDIPLTGDNSELIWVPVDGRSAQGSIYGQRQANVPDFRGTFLRGLNIFDPLNNPIYSKPEQKDPDNRTVNELQTQNVQPHVHAITDPGHAHAIGLKQPGAGGIGATGIDATQSKFDHGTEVAKTGINSTENNAGIETRPTNIAVYYYIKIN